MGIKSIIFIIFWGLLSCSSVAGNYVIHAGTLLDVKSLTQLNNYSILIKDNQIIAVTKGFVEAQDDQQLIDLKTHTVMPGLMDMHVHLSGEINKTSYSEKFFMNESDAALRSVVFASKTLNAGFTTVRDLGDFFRGVPVALRKAIEKGYIQGPRIYAAGKSIATTGGHADPTNGVKLDMMADPGPLQGVINGADDARKAVRQRYKEGADLIKLTVTGGVLSLAKNGSNPQFTFDELQAVVTTAKDYGFTVTVHAHGAEGMKRAIQAGVDSIEHGTYMDAEVIRLMKKNKVYFVPTITAGKWVAEKAAIAGYYPEVVRPKAAAIGPKIHDTFANAYKKGVMIAFGTDAGVFPHGLNAREFEYMVSAGMPAFEAIQSATLNAAKLLRIDNILGSIDNGKLADIVAVEGDPLADIRLMQQISFVMKDGEIIKQ
ncbi:metal-dependent hydrolase family protein [Aliikangiella maris]|uniref:Amidohydrolase family protein n=2 Tax=Aliikangiella maris TaxID=3162458 RepID=A0ABV3MQU2_9GAMM